VLLAGKKYIKSIREKKRKIVNEKKQEERST